MEGCIWKANETPEHQFLSFGPPNCAAGGLLQQPWYQTKNCHNNRLGHRIVGRDVLVWDFWRKHIFWGNAGTKSSFKHRPPKSLFQLAPITSWPESDDHGLHGDLDVMHVA